MNLSLSTNCRAKLRRVSTGLMILASAVFCGTWVAGEEPDKEGIEFFEAKIRPVLVEHCYECHSAKSDEVRGNLRVDTRAGLLDGGDNGSAVVPGKPDESFLMRVIRYEEDDYQMPPEGRLPDEVLADFAKWIEIGAPDPREGDSQQPSVSTAIDIEAGRQFWAFQPVARPPVPQVADANWAVSDIDRFILAAHEGAGVKQVGDASPEAILRRLYFDLIGLPPTPSEQEAFVAAVGEVNGMDYEKRLEAAIGDSIDRLLASPRFGERWARHWMDVARYADSNGLDQNLTHYNAWRYRDYLVASFNSDKPYDRFVIEQLAGDLLPYENERQQTEQLVATGFLMVGPKQLSERDKEKLRMDVVDEQIDTAGKVFLGMTLGCARCHDHKFDPIPMTDYYGMAGIFRSTQTVDGIKLGNVFVSGWKERTLPIEPDHAARLESHAAALASIEGPLKEARESLKKLTGPPQNPRRVEDLPGVIVDDAVAEKTGEWKASTHSPNYVGAGYIHDDKQAKGEKSVTFRATLPASGMYEVRLSFAGSDGRSRRVPVTVKHAEGEDRIEVDQTRPAKIGSLFESLGMFRYEAAEAVVVVETAGTEDGYVIVDAVQFLSADDLAKLAAADKPNADPAKLGDDANADKTDDAATQAKARQRELESRIKQLEGELADLKKNAPPSAPMAMAVEDVADPSDYHVLIRGNHQRLGDPAPRRDSLTVASWDDPAEIAPNQSGRFELAQWIADPKNPLTARVFVNRVWHYLMGEGLVRSVDNFGRLGERPSHPELLDHLASQFIDDGWSIKRLVRRIAMSRTYRLAARHDDAAFAIDPENRLRWRYPRRRLDAECIRDAMLAVSGELEFGGGGPVVGQLPEQAFNNDGPSPIDYDAIPRRSVYLPILRSDVPSMLAAFDFADPELVTGERVATTVPTQALMMMNSPFVARQSEATAARLLRETPAAVADMPDVANPDAARIDRLYRWAFNRLPTAAERKAALAFVQSSASTTPSDNGADSLHAAAMEHAWSRLCHALFAATEFRFLE